MLLPSCVHGDSPLLLSEASYVTIVSTELAYEKLRAVTGQMAPAFKPSTREAEADESVYI